MEAAGLDEIGGTSGGTSGRPVDAASLSPRLYSTDLAPTRVEGRRWRGYNIFTLRANDVHSLGNYTFAIGLFALGLGAWQILMALGIGAVLLFGLLNLSGYMGYKTGVPFPVMSRISFGVRGAQIPALVRGVVGIAWSSDHTLSGGAMWREIPAGAALWVSIYGTFLLNFCDFTRSARSRKAITLGNFWGLPINIGIFVIITVTLAGAQFRIDGTLIESPTDVVRAIPNTLLLVLASSALLVLTIAVNLMANFAAPSYALANLFPKHLSFRRAGLVSAVIGVAILPWNLYNNPVVVEYFLGGLGALLGPLFGVVVIDYWLVRKGRVHVPDLYTEEATGTYHYTHGINPRALAAFLPAAVVAIATALVPAFGAVVPFSWFFGAGIVAVLYCLVPDRRTVHQHVSGESIAVPSVH